MSSQSQYKLLEINLISARDLPPLSKMLRTFAVAYLTPNHKLTTKIDHQGHTNPVWNYKMQFQVEVEFMKQESSTLTIEIYNLAWLRDLPIGTAHLNLNTLLSTPPNRKNATRRVSLQVCRPTGFLKGTVNLTVKLVDIDGPEDDVMSLRDSEIITDYRNQETNDSINQADFKGPNKISCLDKNPGPNKIPDPYKIPSSDKIPGLENSLGMNEIHGSVTSPRADKVPSTNEMPVLDKNSVTDKIPSLNEISSSDKNPGPNKISVLDEIPSSDKNSGPNENSGLEMEISPKTESVCSSSEITHSLIPDSESEMRTATSSCSEYSAMRPLSPEAINDRRRGFLREKAEEEYGSDIFDNWTEAGDISSDEKIPGPEMSPKNESICSASESISTWMPDSEPETRTITSSGSDYSLMKPLPSEVADDLKKGFYRPETTDFGSEIFENWTEGGDTSNDTKSKPEKEASVNSTVVPMKNELELDLPRKRPEKTENKRFKIFGINAYGLEFSFICGSKSMRMRSKKKDMKGGHVRAFSDETLGKFHRR